MVDGSWKEMEAVGSVQSTEREGWECTEGSSPFV